MKSHLISAILILSSLFNPEEIFAAPETSNSVRQPRYLGTGSCSSSNCHGSVNPIKGSNVLQNEYHTWLKRDRHSKAYLALESADSKKIARHLKLGDPTREPLCLECHATYVADKNLRGERYTVEDGVSCESCHGAAGAWLASHSETSATHQGNLANGLADTVSLDKRARLCLSCHYGNETKGVTHQLYGAGHPRLRFELDTYGILEPKHWVVDGDYRARKADYIPIRAWFIGQVAHAKLLLNKLKNPHTKTDAVFPELSLFDCFSCHHSLEQAQWKTHEYRGSPGRLKVNLSPLRLLQAALSELDPELSDKMSQQSDIITNEYGTDSSKQAIQELSSTILSQIQERLDKVNGDLNGCRLIIQGLARSVNRGATVTFESAEQIGMGIQAAIATSPELARRYEAKLSELFKTIEKSDSFDHLRFKLALEPFTSA